MVDRRLTWLVRFVALWGVAIFIQLTLLQVMHHRRFSKLARDRQELSIPIPAPRGTIFDRTGRPMAMSVPAESVYLNPLKVPNLEFAAGLLSRALHLDRPELYA